MIRNLKALGLALVAMFAFSAMAASSASAVDTFTSEANPETVTATSHDNKFTITGVGSLVCTTASFHGNVANGSSEATFNAAYTGTINVVNPHTTHCNSALGALEVFMNKCSYILTGNTDQEDESSGNPNTKVDAEVWVECADPTKEEIELKITGLGVTLEIPGQTPTGGGVRYTNEAGGKVKIDITATGITYTCTPTFLCGLGGVPSEGDNADYTGTLLAHGKNGPISVTES